MIHRTLWVKAANCRKLIEMLKDLSCHFYYHIDDFPDYRFHIMIEDEELLLILLKIPTASLERT